MGYIFILTADATQGTVKRGLMKLMSSNNEVAAWMRLPQELAKSVMYSDSLNIGQILPCGSMRIDETAQLAQSMFGSLNQFSS
jgi:hypothetical protein